jgi:hypothetical protein
VVAAQQQMLMGWTRPQGKKQKILSLLIQLQHHLVLLITIEHLSPQSPVPAMVLLLRRPLLWSLREALFPAKRLQTPQVEHPLQPSALRLALVTATLQATMSRQ